MALSLRQVIPIGVSLCVLAAPAIGQPGGALPNAGQSPESREARLTPECRVPASFFAPKLLLRTFPRSSFFRWCDGARVI
jgi:hypothetical protein